MPDHAPMPPQLPDDLTADAPAPAAARSRLAHREPDQIGPFRILEKVGEGGMGLVYRAEQREPVRRVVALKVIKLGMDTKEVVARFEAERQALATLSHPHVAKVFEAGMTEQGRPYFAMEYVAGIPLTQYCDENRLSTRQRIELFVPVCQAVQHAHQKGIIHRDLKPSNILVTLMDGKAVPKVIDFGIAKATNQALTQHTLFTQTGALIGTPEYMSPEQAQTSGLDVDTRTDIYSLGVILYELLTGSLPIDPKSLRSAGIEGMARLIKTAEPQKPSTRLMTLAGAAGADTLPGQTQSVRHLQKELRGDLDWIVLKAMEKDRSRRYETANGLAADLNRHLDNEPVTARPPSAMYRFQKAFKRNRLAFTAAAAVILALSIGLAASMALFYKESQAHRRAVDAEKEQNRLRQEAQASEARQTLLKQLAQQQELVARQRAYASDMNRVQQALSLNKLGQAQELLYRHKPAPGESDLRGWEWRYLWGQCRSDALAEMGPEPKSISSMSISSDGRLLALGQLEGGRFAVWDLQTRRRVVEQRAGDGVVQVAFSPHEFLLAYSMEIGLQGNFVQDEVCLWNGITRQIVAKCPLNGRCLNLRFGDDGRSIYVLSQRETLELTVWQVPEGNQLKRFRLDPSRGFPFGVLLAVSRDQRLAAYTAKDNELRVLDLATGQERWKATIANEYVLGLAFSPDGKMLASGGGFTPSDIDLWDVDTGTRIGQPLQGHRGWVGSMVFWPDGKKLASASSDQTIRLWDISNPKKIPPPRILRGHKLEVWPLVLMPDNRTLISGGKDGSVMMWDTTLDRRESENIVIPGPHLSWQPASTGKAVFTVGTSGRIARWSGEGFRTTEVLLDIGDSVTGGCIIEDKGMAAVAFMDGRVQFWDLPKRMLIHETRPFSGPLRDGWRFVRGADHLLFCDGYKTIVQFRLSTPRDFKSWTNPANDRLLLAQSPDQRYRIEVDHRGIGSMTDSGTGQTQPLNLGQTQLCDLACSSDGKLFAVASYSGYGGLWDTATLKPAGVLRGFLQGVHSVAFSPDGRRIAAGSGNKEAVKLWDLDSREEVMTLEGTGSSFWSTAFSPDGNLLGSTNNNGVLRLWIAPSWEQITADEEAAATAK